MTASSIIPAKKAARSSLLGKPERHPLVSPESACALGRVVVAAPHPDDESLGCGGLLALLADAGLEPQVFVLTDGSRSHPHSASHPATRLAALREEETLAALSELGLPGSAAHFLRFGDCALPSEGTPAFVKAAALLREMLAENEPDTLLVPWRRDPHCDHEGTWRLLRAAWAGMPAAPRWLAVHECFRTADAGKWRLISELKTGRYRLDLFKADAN